LFIGLYNLSFTDNFKSYEWEGSILAGEEQQINHNLGSIPTRFFVLSASGTNSIIAGDTAPTAELFYIKNIASSSTFNGKVLILP
jgi:hypothetical protein